MELVVLKSNIKKCLDALTSGVGVNPNVPMTANVLLETQGNKIKVSSTNLEIGINCALSGKIIEAGAVSVPYGVFSSIVNNISSERINLKNRENNLIIQTDSYEALVQGQNKSEFPIIPQLESKKNKVVLDKDVFGKSLERVVIAAGTSDLRPEINGALFSSEAGVVKIAATDSFRLAEEKIKNRGVHEQPETGFNLILPLKSVEAIIKIIRFAEEDKVTLYAEANQVLISAGNVDLISRVIDGKFPDYEAIIPSSSETEITLPREELLSALKLASSFTSRIKDVNLRTKNQKTLEVYSGDNSLGENKYMIACKIKGEDSEITFNLKYILDGVKAQNSDEITLSLNGNNKPGLIKSPKDDSYIYVVMPIKT
ncbi:MAG: DNA polymerase III subunit beta [Candidatus Colwellbacteria bacterium]|nr:DNA polymerase III subunit beta [Candidatus Colwellbacteria bacterium]